MSATAPDARAFRTTGAIAAVACGLLPLAALAVTLARLVRQQGGQPPAEAPGLVLAGAGVAAALGVALACVAAAARLRLGGGRIGAAGAALGALGALTLLGSAALAEAHGGGASPWSVRLAEAAPVLEGGWALCIVAVAWRVRRWPAWLRVTGAVWGAAEMMLPAIPPLGPVVLLVGLVWWAGVAAQLARRPAPAESTSP